jgi:hypothetical protein
MIKKDDKVSIYRRILKYPPFAVRKKSGAMLITHNTAHGKVVARAVEYVTTEDAEKLYCIIYIAQKNNTVTAIPVSDKDFGDIIRVDVEIKDIKKIVNSHDETSILNSINRLQSLDITYFELEKKKIVSQIGIHPLLKYLFQSGTGILTLFLDKNFYNACNDKALQIDISKYSKLSATGKNLYGFIASNSGEIFTESLLIERAVIQAERKDKAQNSLKKALNELKKEYIINNFKIEKKDGIRQIVIEKYSN